MTKTKDGAPKRNTILHPSDMPERYCMRADGNCMEPVFFEGDPLMMDTTVLPARGDFVAIWRRRDLVKPGEYQILIKRLLRYDVVNGAESAIVEMLNPQVSLVFPLNGIEAIHLCRGVVPKSLRRVKFTDEEFMSMARSAA
jgi:hypothetical protein